MAIFSKKEKIQLDQQTISTIISSGCVLDGNFKAPGVARIEGTLNGNVEVADGLILGEKGIINGNITTQEIIVYGEVNGDIACSSIEIRTSGKINGDIKTQSLSVETGGAYNGRIVMS